MEEALLFPYHTKRKNCPSAYQIQDKVFRPKTCPIFSTFFQSSRTKGKKEGTGIGLYLVKTYTELHGGQVNLVSEENKGTTVTITLPIFQEAETFPSKVQPENHKKETCESTDTLPSVLIVDDNPEIINFIHDILHSHYHCLTAPEGKQG